MNSQEIFNIIGIIVIVNVIEYGLYRFTNYLKSKRHKVSKPLNTRKIFKDINKHGTTRIIKKK